MRGSAPPQPKGHNVYVSQYIVGGFVGSALTLMLLLIPALGAYRKNRRDR